MEIPDFTKKVYAKYAEGQKVYPCHVNRASSIGYFMPALGGCQRRGVYERTSWKDKEPWPAEMLMIFKQGREQERQVLVEFAEAGVDVIEQQSAFDWPKYKIVGHVDGVIVVDGEPLPLEIKSQHPSIFMQTRKLEDFQKKPWLRAYIVQLMLYCLMKNVEHGIFIMRDKSHGQLRQINLKLDYDLAEKAIKTCETINAHVEAGTLPERIEDRQTCSRCPFKLICLPAIQWGEPLKIVDDPTAESKISEYLKLKDSADKCKKVYEIVRDEAKAQAGEGGELNLMVGKYHLTGAVDSRKAFRLKIDRID